MTSASIVWFTLAAFSPGGGEDNKVAVKKEDEDGTRIKEEPLDESTTSPWGSSLDVSNDQPERSVKKEKEKEKEYQADNESDETLEQLDSGAGTGLESSRAQGVQRRRRHLYGDDESS